MKKITTNFSVNDFIEEKLSERGQNITDALNEIIENARESGLSFFPKLREWKDLKGRRGTQRPLTLEERDLLQNLAEEYNISRAKLITLMLLNLCRNEPAKA